MEKTGQLYTLGHWTVKPGNEADFIRVWDEFAQWTAEHQPGVGTGRLLQDLDHPDRFVSFGPWESAENIRDWRGTPEFTEFVTKARELCEEIQPRTLKLVAQSAARENG